MCKKMCPPRGHNGAERGSEMTMLGAAMSKPLKRGQPHHDSHLAGREIEPDFRGLKWKKVMLELMRCLGDDAQ
jgi:hypothetical protein